MSDESAQMNAQRRAGRFFRKLLRHVRPEHVPDMIEMLWQMGHSAKPINVPDGEWTMSMPYDYQLRGEGPVGYAIEPPPPRQEIMPADDGDAATPAPLRESDTATIVRLCAEARGSERPARDQQIAQLHSLNCDRCEEEAVEAIELLLHDLIAGAATD